MFLTNTPALDGWMYTPRDLERARAILESGIHRIAPSWLSQPKGPLAIHWNADGPYPTCYLIDLACCLVLLSQYGDENSQSILDRKLGQLLIGSNEEQFEATLTELRFGAHLTGRIRPVSLEPLAGRESPANPAVSPDFGATLWHT